MGEGGTPIFTVRATPLNTRCDDVRNFIFRPESTAMKTVNLKSDMPLVLEALQRLDGELASARTGQSDFPEAGPRLRLNRRGRRYSRRSAKAFTRADPNRSDSRLYLR